MTAPSAQLLEPRPKAARAGLAASDPQRAYEIGRQAVLVGDRGLLLIGEERTERMAVLDRIIADLPRESLEVMRIRSADATPASLAVELRTALRGAARQEGRARVVLVTDDDGALSREALLAMDCMASSAIPAEHRVRFLISGMAGLQRRLTAGVPDLADQLAVVTLPPPGQQQAVAAAPRRSGGRRIAAIGAATITAAVAGIAFVATHGIPGRRTPFHVAAPAESPPDGSSTGAAGTAPIRPGPAPATNDRAGPGTPGGIAPAGQPGPTAPTPPEAENAVEGSGGRIAASPALPGAAPGGSAVGPPSPDPAAAAAGLARPAERGLLVLARAGDTLEGLYRKVYRGQVNAPPLAQLASVYPAYPSPGDAMFFPSPEGGWNRP